MSKKIDYTKMRKGTRTSGSCRIDYCPKCGRKGEKGEYPGGAIRFIHKGHIEWLFLVVDEACTIPVPKAPAEVLA